MFTNPLEKFEMQAQQQLKIAARRSHQQRAWIEFAGEDANKDLRA